MRAGTGQRGDERLRAMAPEERQAFCREVLASLSELVEGEAPEELCRRVEEILGSCRPFLSYRNTFAATRGLLRKLGAEAGALPPEAEASFARCLSRLKG